MIFYENPAVDSEKVEGTERTAKNTQSVMCCLREKLLFISVLPAFVSYSWTKDATLVHFCDKNIAQMLRRAGFLSS